MSTKELIQTEIESLSEEDLNELYGIIKSFVQSKTQTRKPGLMSRLKRIKIYAPEDFATNLDLYMSGEKRVE